MGEKARQKQQMIVEKAREVFCQRGYRNVTMKDIVEACEISRGGLYLYFSSTRELFEAVLEMEEENSGEELSMEQLQNATMGQMLLFFFKEQKREILLKKNNLCTAKYEYAFACMEEKMPSSLRKHYETGVLALQKILENGNKTGEFMCEEPKQEAANIMFAIEGMKICAKTMGMSEKSVDREFLHLMKRFVIEE